MVVRNKNLAVRKRYLDSCLMWMPMYDREPITNYPPQLYIIGVGGGTDNGTSRIHKFVFPLIEIDACMPCVIKSGLL